MPKVSVIIPVFNADQYLRQCLDSVVSQTIRDIEIVAVDDGSSDSSATILNEYAVRDNRIQVVTQLNRGVSAARNAGLNLITGDYVTFVDADDFFEPTLIEEMYGSCLAHDADVGICKIRYLCLDKGTSVEASWSLRTDLLPDIMPFSRSDMAANIFLSVTPSVWNKMFKRSFIIDQNLHFFPELLRADDLPFTYLALVLAKRIVAVDRALVNYRTGIPTSLQATVHERPTEICRALDVVKKRAIEEGIFSDIEHDFVNAAIDQCLYTLGAVRTLDAFNELYDALTSRYFEELGIEGRAKDYFTDIRYYEGYSMLRELSPEAYLFDAVRDLRKREENVRQAYDAESRALSETSQSLSETAEALDNAREALTTTGAALSEMQIKCAQASEEAGLRAAEVQMLDAQLDAIRGELFDEARALRGELEETRIRVKQATAKLNKTSAKVKKIRASRSYRAGRVITAVPRKLKRMFGSLWKAK